MTFFEWINKNHNKVMDKVKLICPDENEQYDLFQSVVLQLLEKPNKINDIPDKEKMYFFIRVIKNNYNSTTSIYYKEYKKHQNLHTPLLDEITESLMDEGYEDTIPEIEWVNHQLKSFDWFDRDLFLMWIELKTITNVSKTTQIPLNSVGRYINKTKYRLQELWKQETSK